MVMLTATLMKTMERDFRDMLLLPDARIIRDRTTKKNARYEFVEVGRKDGAVEKSVVQFVRRTLTTMMSHEKCIVYCKSIDDCRAMAEELGCLCHHSAMSDAARKEAVALWLCGQGNRVMAATTGLGTGVDIAGIVVVAHSGMPYGLVDYIQQTGRGARQGGQFVRCVAMYDGTRPFEGKGITNVALNNQHAMWTVATAPGCIREQIAMMMDGVLGECCADVPDAVPCGRCEPSYAFRSAEAGAAVTPGDDASNEIAAEEVGTHALVRRIDAEDTRARGLPTNTSVFHEDTRQRATDELTVKRWLVEVEDKCAACFTKKLLAREADSGSGHQCDDEDGHEALWTSCPSAEGMEPYQKIRARLRFATHSCCFKCKLPLDWCAKAKDDKGTPDRCVYMDKVLPAILITANITREAEWIRDSFGVDPTDNSAFLQWLAGKREFMDTRGTNMHMLWTRIVQKTYGPGMAVV